METVESTVAEANPTEEQESSGGIVDATPGTQAKEVKKEADKPAIDLKAKVKAKVYDQEEDVTVEDLLKTYQKERAADEKFRKAAEFEKRAKEYESKIAEMDKKLKEDPWSVLQERGLDPDEIAERRLLQKLQWDMMSDEQKESHKLKKENDELKARQKWLDEQEEERKQQLANQQKEDLKLKEIENIDTTLTTSLKERGLKPTPMILESVAQYMLAHLNAPNGNKNITPAEALEYVLKQSDSEFFSKLDSYDVGKLMERLNPKTKESIRKWFVDQIQTSQPTAKLPTASPATKAKRTSTEDFFKNLEQKYGS